MNLLRLSAVMVGCFAIAVAAAADEKAVDKDKLVGTWKLTKEDGKATKEKVVFQFTKDGKFKNTSPVTEIIVGGKNKGEKTTKMQTTEGTYKLDGDKIYLVPKIRGKEEKLSVTIKILTDKKLVMVVPDGKEAEFEKTK